MMISAENGDGLERDRVLAGCSSHHNIYIKKISIIHPRD